MTADLSTERAWLDRHVRLADSAVALVVLAVSLQPLLEQAGCGCADVPPWGPVLVVAQACPLVWRRRWPFAAGLAAGMITAVHGLTSLAEPALPFAGLVGLYSAAAHSRRRLSWLAAVIAAVAITVTLLLDAPNADAQDFTVNYLVFATAWLLGDSARIRRERSADLEVRVEQAERMRAADAQRVVAQERTRIARELHDVVAPRGQLTNTLKHAGQARARVTVRYDAEAVHLLVADDGAGARTERDRSGPASSRGNGWSAGNGLVGMRERVAVLGGTLVAGPVPGGGWAVSADLPAPVLVAP